MCRLCHDSKSSAWWWFDLWTDLLPHRHTCIIKTCFVWTNMAAALTHRSNSQRQPLRFSAASPRNLSLKRSQLSIRLVRRLLVCVCYTFRYTFSCVITQVISCHLKGNVSCYIAYFKHECAIIDITYHLIVSTLNPRDPVSFSKTSVWY